MSHTMILALAFAALIAGVWLTRSPVAEVRQLPCMSHSMREQLRALMLEGIDRGFVSYTERIYLVWVKDSAERRPQSSIGSAQNVHAYVTAVAAAQAWSPPLCKE